MRGVVIETGTYGQDHKLTRQGDLRHCGGHPGVATTMLSHQNESAKDVVAIGGGVAYASRCRLEGLRSAEAKVPSSTHLC